jgi:hypothetical protein
MAARIPEAWPDLPLSEWSETRDTLHMLTQIVGKARLELEPPQNHTWQVALYVTPTGLTTGPMPYKHRTLQIDFDFIEHRIKLVTSDGERASVMLNSRPVCDTYREIKNALESLNMPVKIWTTPVEVEDRTPFEQVTHHRTYDPAAVTKFHRCMVQIDRVFKKFRCDFQGKVSPVHFFWGAFDLAVTRFSGRPAPEHPGVPGVAKQVMVEAYSHECSSAGWWPGGGMVQDPAFYAYAYPEPDGFRTVKSVPGEAYYDEGLGEYLLPYNAVRTAEDPDDLLLRFLRGTYEAAADNANWDRGSLERS